MASKNTREVKVGLMTYRDANGVEGRTAALGETVEVHADDLERFDRLNGPGEPVDKGDGIDDVSEDSPAGRADEGDAPAARQSAQPARRQG